MCCIFRENFSYPPVYPKRLPYTQYTLYSIPCIPAKKVSHFLRKGLVYSRIPGIPSYTRIPNSEHRDLMEHYLTQVSYTFVSLVHLSYTLYTLYTGQKCFVFSEKTSRIPLYTQNAYRIPRRPCIPAKKVSHFLRKVLVYSRILSYTLVYLRIPV